MPLPKATPRTGGGRLYAAAQHRRTSFTNARPRQGSAPRKGAYVGLPCIDGYSQYYL